MCCEHVSASEILRTLLRSRHIWFLDMQRMLQRISPIECLLPIETKTIVANKACRSVRRVSIVTRSASELRLNVRIHNHPVDRRWTPWCLTRRRQRVPLVFVLIPSRDRHLCSLRNNTAIVKLFYERLYGREHPVVRIQLDALSRPRPHAVSK